MARRPVVLILSSLLFAACSGTGIDLGPYDGGASSEAGATSPDNGTGAAADASAKGDASALAACDIDHVTGTFSVSYTLISGNCGELPSAEYTLQEDWPWNTPGCVVKAKSTSVDRCVSTGSATCSVNDSQLVIQGALTQTSADAIDGTIEVQAATGGAQCSGTYAIAYRRKL